METPTNKDHPSTESPTGGAVTEPTGPRILLVYYTYTQQSSKVAEAMADVLRERGCDVRQAAIEFTDKRWAERFSRFPLRHVYRDLLGMLPTVLEHQPQVGAEARNQTRRRVRRRHSLLVRRRADSVAPVAVQLLRHGGEPRALPGSEDPPEQPQVGLPGAGSGVRERAGGSAAQHGRGCGEASTREQPCRLQLRAGGKD
jgi:hypothetical protein